MIADLFSLALKNLRHRGVRSWLTLLGIFIGVMAVVALISLGNGLKVAINSQFGISATEVISVQAGGVTAFGPPGTGVVNKLDEDDLEAIEDLSRVDRAVRRNIESGNLEFNDKTIFGFTANIPDGDARDFIYEFLDAPPIAGRLLRDGDRGKVVLGYNFFIDNVGLEKVVEPGKTVTILGEDFEVIGVTEKKGSFIFDNIVYMNEDDLQDLTGYGETIDVIAVLPKDKEDLSLVKADIEKALRKTRDVKEGEEDFEVSTPDASLSTVNDILTGVTAFIAIVASISIFIGGVGIVNTMTTSVLERRKEIGIMKAIGAKNSHIFGQFLLESSLLGLIGGIVGVIFGTAIGIGGTIGINNWIGAQTQPNIDFILILSTLLGSFIVGGVAGITPALSASRQNPVEVIRG